MDGGPSPDADEHRHGHFLLTQFQLGNEQRGSFEIRRRLRVLEPCAKRSQRH